MSPRFAARAQYVVLAGVLGLIVFYHWFQMNPWAGAVGLAIGVVLGWRTRHNITEGP